MLTSIDHKVLSTVIPYADHNKKLFQSWAIDEDGYNRHYRVLYHESPLVQMGIIFTEREKIVYEEVWEIDYLKDDISLAVRILEALEYTAVTSKDIQALLDYITNLTEIIV